MIKFGKGKDKINGFWIQENKDKEQLLKVALVKQFKLPESDHSLSYRGTFGRSLEEVRLRLYDPIEKIQGKVRFEHLEQVSDQIVGVFEHFAENSIYLLRGIWGEKGLLLKAQDPSDNKTLFYIDIPEFNPDSTQLKASWIRDDGFDLFLPLFKELLVVESFLQEKEGEHQYRLSLYKDSLHQPLKTAFEVLDWGSDQLLYRIDGMDCDPELIRNKNAIRVGDYNFDGVHSDVLIPCSRYNKGINAHLAIYSHLTESQVFYGFYSNIDWDADFNANNKEIVETSFSQNTKTETFSRWNGNLLEPYQEKKYYFDDDRGVYTRDPVDIANEQFLITHKSMGPLVLGMSLKRALSFFPTYLPKTTYFYDEAYSVYEVMDQNNQPLFSLTNNTSDDLNLPVITIRIHSPQYKTFKGLNVNSTFGDLKRFFPGLNYEAYGDFVTVSTPYFPAARLYFSLEELEEGWWDTANNRFDPTKIPPSLRIEIFEMVW